VSAEGGGNRRKRQNTAFESNQNVSLPLRHIPVHCSIRIKAPHLCRLPAPHPHRAVLRVHVARHVSRSRLLSRFEVSTPSHAKYGHFLKQAEIDMLTAPAAEDMHAVTGWLAQHPAIACSTDREVLSFHGTAAAAAHLLQTELFVYTNAAAGRALVRAAPITLPALVDAAVAAVVGLHGNLPPMRRTRLPAAQRGDAPPANVTPAVLADTYGIPGSVHKAGNTTYRQAVVELFSSHMSHRSFHLLRPIRAWGQGR
jgi:hypothetical protein